MANSKGQKKGKLPSESKQKSESCLYLLPFCVTGQESLHMQASAEPSAATDKHGVLQLGGKGE